MKKSILSILMILILTPSLSFAQRTRQASCANQSSAHWYIMPYAGIGAAWYSYDLNGTVITPDGKTIERAETKTIMTYHAGIHMLYHFSAINLGIGGEWQGFNGSLDQGTGTVDLSLYYFKFYGRIEAPIYSDSFNDFGAYANVGLIIPNNTYGDKPSPGGYIEGGLYYNLILNKSSSFLFALGYQQAGFNTTIGQAVSKHSQSDLKLTIGYRFWF